jgi:hypothetical protein
MQFITYLGGIAIVTLSACLTQGTGPALAPEPPATPPQTTPCGAGDLQTLIGQDRSVLATMRFAPPVRILGPDDIATMDYLPNRLNIRYDAQGVIQSITCG